MRIAYLALYVLIAAFIYSLVVPDLTDNPQEKPDFEAKLIER
ncbi:MAG: hypothetical protein OYG31_01965 [Candidatus Kaiserbacteria bacterium]|nr:hypothetical protein [Candidatus Kaiserbacteria bacterium]